MNVRGAVAGPKLDRAQRWGDASAGRSVARSAMPAFNSALRWRIELRGSAPQPR